MGPRKERAPCGSLRKMRHRSDHRRHALHLNGAPSPCFASSWELPDKALCHRRLGDSSTRLQVPNLDTRRPHGDLTGPNRRCVVATSAVPVQVAVIPGNTRLPGSGAFLRFIQSNGITPDDDHSLVKNEWSATRSWPCTPAGSAGLLPGSMSLVGPAAD